MKAVYISTTGDDSAELATHLEVDFKDSLYLCCDICEESYVNNNKKSILKQINRSSNGNVNKYIDHVIWLKVMKPNINSIRLYIADEFGKIVSVNDTILNCTLLFTPAP